MKTAICRCRNKIIRIIIFLLHRHIAVFLDDDDVSTLPLPTHLWIKKIWIIKIIYCRLCYWLKNTIKAQRQILVHFYCSLIVFQLHLDYTLMWHFNCIFIALDYDCMIITLRLHFNYITLGLHFDYTTIAMMQLKCNQSAI